MKCVKLAVNKENKTDIKTQSYICVYQASYTVRLNMFRLTAWPSSRRSTSIARVCG
jgi:hypothetical protein